MATNGAIFYGLKVQHFPNLK